MESQLHELNVRIDRLEKKNRFLTWLMIGVPLLCLFLSTAYAEISDKQVVTGRIVTRDLIIHDGKVNRIVLAINPVGQTAINVFDKDGKRVAALGEER